MKSHRATSGVMTPGAGLQRAGAGRGIVSRHPLKALLGGVIKAARGNETKRAARSTIRMQHLHARVVRTHDPERRVDKRLVQRRSALLLDQLRAEMLEELRIRQLDTQLPLALPQCVLAESPFDELGSLPRQQIEKANLALGQPGAETRSNAWTACRLSARRASPAVWTAPTGSRRPPAADRPVRICDTWIVVMDDAPAGSSPAPGRMTPGLGVHAAERWAAAASNPLLASSTSSWAPASSS